MSLSYDARNVFSLHIFNEIQGLTPAELRKASEYYKTAPKNIFVYISSFVIFLADGLNVDLIAAAFS